jgi:hypothetical protein
MIKSCNCKSEYQDKKYGVGKRVHNQAQSVVKGEIAWRCTICGSKK